MTRVTIENQVKTKIKSKSKIKVKGFGQECPTHMSNCKNNGKVKGCGPAARDSRGRLSPHEQIKINT